MRLAPQEIYLLARLSVLGFVLARLRERERSLDKIIDWHMRRQREREREKERERERERASRFCG
jgi:hypothetical protein